MRPVRASDATLHPPDDPDRSYPRTYQYPVSYRARAAGRGAINHAPGTARQVSTRRAQCTAPTLYSELVVIRTARAPSCTHSFAMVVLQVGVLSLAAVAGTVAATGAAPPPRTAMVWVPDSALGGNLNGTLTALAPYAARNSFNAFAYQAYSLCGRNNHNCNSAKKTGEPYFSCVHSTDSCGNVAVSARAALGPHIATWPLISMNGPDCDFLNGLLKNETLTTAFTNAAIAEAHTFNFTGYNLDFESHGINGDEHPKSADGQYELTLGWVASFAQKLHAASPRIGVSYDTGVGPQWGSSKSRALIKASPVDRLISMATYNPKFVQYESELSAWSRAVGSRYGVGLCPACQNLTEAEVKSRFEVLRLHKGAIFEIDVWAFPDGYFTEQWWDLMAEWLRG